MLLENKKPNTAIALQGGVDYRPMVPDPPRRLTRYVWFVFLGGLLGVGGGCLCFLAQDPKFRSTARLQIIDLGKASRPQVTETEKNYGSPLSDEALVIRSERMLRQAAEIGGLEKTALFSGWTHEAIAVELNRSESLIVAPAFSDVQTNVIRIQFDAPDPMTPQRVVQAIVDAYSQHTQVKTEKDDDLAIQQILSARDAAAEQLRELERQHDEFKQRTDLLFVNGEPRSIHRNTADRYLAQREELLVSKAEYESQLHAAEDSLKRDESPATVMLALRGETETPSDVIDQSISNRLQRIREESQNRASARTRETQLLPLQMERNEFLKNFGPRHPTVRSIDQKISIVESQIERMEAEERKKDALIAQAMSLRDNVSEDLDPNAEMRKRVDVALSALRQRLDSIQQQIRAVDEAYEEESEAAKREIVAERESRRFEREIARQTELYERLLARLDDVQLATGTQGLSVFPLDEAQIGIPVVGSIEKWGLAGGLLGVVSASLLALLFPFSDGSYRSSDQVAKHLRMPVLGHVPLLPAMEESDKSSLTEHPEVNPRLCTVHSPYGRTADGFNAIRTALLFSEAARGDQIIQITSATPGAGKSTVSANLAVSMARLGKNVLLVDADLRQPSVQQLFGLRDGRGLGWLLETFSESDRKEDVNEFVGEVIQEGPVGNLSIMIAGTSQTNPSELCASDRIPVLFEALRDKFDLIIIDSPPMLAVTDPSALASRSDAVLLVVRCELNDMSQAAHATDMLATLNANVIGVIVNGIDEHGRTGYRIYPATGGLRSRSNSIRDGAGYSYGSGEFGEYYARSDDTCESDAAPSE